MLVAEGSEFAISRSFDTTGLVGSLSSTVRWGDGTETAGTVTGAADNNTPIQIRFEYQGNFFNDPIRKNLLQSAADSVIGRFSDDLEAITPSSLLQWTAVTTNPTTGASQSFPNLSVAANELVIYVGGRDLPGNRVGEAGPGGFSFPGGGSFTQEQLNQINAFRTTVQYRGETGAELANPTDFGPWGGFISFDTSTNWHFGASTDGLDSDEVDFSSVAAHELMHVLGFGLEYAGSVNSTFETYTNGTSFTGPRATAVNGGPVPLHGTNHFSEDVLSRGQKTVGNPTVEKGDRLTLTPLDLATLDDLGWTIRTAPTAMVTATHVYADNPDTGSTFPVEVVLRGSSFGDITQSLTPTVTNVAPTLTGPGNQTVQIGETLSIPNIGEISDPGFANSSTPSTETFTYQIDWRDGTTDAGDATIDRQGTSDPTVPTLASFDGSHVYESLGTFTAILTVTDDDGAMASSQFTVTVTPPPALSLSLSKPSVVENEGADSAALTVIRSGAVRNTDQTITLSSDDTSEATIPGSVVIRAGEDRATVPIAAVDDTLFDGVQTVTFSASAAGADPGDITFSVQDHETIDAVFTAATVLENDASSVRLRITRSNTDGTEPLAVNIAGGNASQLDMPNSAEIPAGQQSVDITLAPINDDAYELTLALNYTVSATGYPATSASIDLLDDEPPKYQNQTNRYNVNNRDDVSPLDVLLIINALAVRGQSPLDPALPVNDLFFDVNGDYQISPLDVLLVINKLALDASLGEEQISPPTSTRPRTPVAATDFLMESLVATDDEEELMAMGLDRFQLT